MYTFDSRIRYSETDHNGLLSLDGLLNYFQDCSFFEAEKLGIGIEYLREKHLAWVLSSWQISVERYPKLYTKVTTGTFPYQFKGFVGLRNFFMTDEEGRNLAKANSIWVLLNTDTGKPVFLPEEMLEKYEMHPALDMEYPDRKIKVPEAGESMETITVTEQNLDTNQHVNNGQYVRMAMNFLPRNLNISRLRVEYKMQARLGDRLMPYVVRNDGFYTVSLRDRNGEPYVNVEFKVSEENYDSIR